MNKGSCLPTERLSDFDLGLLSAKDARELERHLAVCERCRAELEALRRTAQAASELELVRAPQDLWARIEKRLEPRSRLEAERRRPSLVLRWAAVAAIALLLILVPAFWPRHAPAPVQLPVEVSEDADLYRERYTLADLAAISAPPGAPLVLVTWEGPAESSEDGG